MSPDSLHSGQAAGPDRYGSPRASYRGRGGAVVDGSEPRNGAVTNAFDAVGEDKPRLPSLDPAAPPEPVFAPGDWLAGETGSLADHPLLRGLLLELPPKGSALPPGWLDRWFEATRAILELLYVR